MTGWSSPLNPGGEIIEVSKLGVAAGMLGALGDLGVGLQPVPEAVQQGATIPSRSDLGSTGQPYSTGLPALSLPFGAPLAGLPIGVQLVSRWQSDEALPHVAARLETVSPVAGRRPPL